MDGAVAAVRAGALELVGGAVLPFSECIWCTQGGAQPWLRKTGLALDAAGFIDVDATLRATNDPAVFAAGDIHSSKQYPRPKAGVYAVRQVSSACPAPDNCTPPCPEGKGTSGCVIGAVVARGHSECWLRARPWHLYQQTYPGHPSFPFLYRRDSLNSRWLDPESKKRRDKLH